MRVFAGAFEVRGRAISLRFNIRVRHYASVLVDLFLLQLLHLFWAQGQQGRTLSPCEGLSVGLVDAVKSAATVVQEFKEEFAEAVIAMQAMVEE